MAKKVKADMSGFCRFNDEVAHRMCRGEWETPSVIVRCECPGHEQVVEQVVARVIVPKVKRQGAKKMMAKKSRTPLA